MAKSLVVATKFTAIDKFSRVVAKMNVGVNKFVSKAEVGFARVQRAERKMRNGFKKSLGMVGRLGLGFTALALAQNIFTANTELESKLANLHAITGVTVDVFKGFEKQIDEVSKKQKMFAGDTADAFTVIGSAQPELLKNAKGLGMVTDAAMILSKASKDDLTLSAQNLTGAMNQFNLKADESYRVINVLAAGSKEGAANITEINESLTKFGAVANDSNVSIEESVALIEVLASKSIKGADAGTMLRSSIINLKKAGVGYQSGLFNMKDALQDVNDKLLKLGTAKERDAYMNKIFGKTGITAGQILVNNAQMYDDLTKKVTKTNVAQEQADINSNTLINRWNELVNVFNNAITSTDEENSSLTSLKDILVYVTEHMDTIIAVTKVAIGVFLAYKAIMLATKVGIIAYNVAMGVMGAITGISNIAIGKSKVALLAYNVVSKITTATTWLFSAAMWSIPIVWIIAGIIALIAVVVAIATHWDTWGKKIVKFLSPMNAIIEAISFLGDEWDAIVKAFKSEGILGGLKRIGQAILRFMVKPFAAAADILAEMGLFDEGVGARMMSSLGIGDEQVVMGDKQTERGKVNPEATIVKKSEKTQTSYLNINNNTGMDATLTGNDPNIKLTNSMQWAVN